MVARKPYAGTERKLILGLDLGTTFAGISYCLLDPGKIPQILPVTRFPSQPPIGGDSKVPSIVMYDGSGMARAFGAEALDEDVKQVAAREGWQQATWFKLHMQPDAITVPRADTPIPPLPRNKTATSVFSDFLGYLLKCARTYITEHYPGGDALWITLEDTTEFILTHPNGWGGSQQAMMREAAKKAGLVRGMAGRKRIHFVTEGEASLHYCILNGLASGPLDKGEGVIIVDAGGGTVDISAYHKTSNADDEVTRFGEIARAECLMFGSVFVGRSARRCIEAKLRNSRYLADAEEIAQRFDESAKLKFRDTDQFSWIKFGSLRDSDEAFGIINGQMKLPGKEVAGFFQPSIDAIIAAIRRQKARSHAHITSVCLVGGFAASEWLFSEVKRRLGEIGLDVSRPDSNVNKAVSDGAVSFYLDHFVTARVAKDTYGTDCTVSYDATDREHRARTKLTQVNLAGERCLPVGFSAILRRDVKVDETKEFRASFGRKARDVTHLMDLEVDILKYTGFELSPRWMDVDRDKYSKLCAIKADVTNAARNLRPRIGPSGVYYQSNFDVVLSFGLTELTAQLAWWEDGEEKRGEAEVIYDGGARV
ncbi:MYND-type domain-containing protein [Mycena chlorophos]|uniref:MYND-type domain-containing protein n=1 Tax=Mycena chlorophos TaxID=658473 RepID=A0A8H6VW93_MYCCL|nr:MYND-type domain-containing protein [Mycena chlorophos]